MERRSEEDLKQFVREQADAERNKRRRAELLRLLEQRGYKPDTAEVTAAMLLCEENNYSAEIGVLLVHMALQLKHQRLRDEIARVELQFGPNPIHPPEE